MFPISRVRQRWPRVFLLGLALAVVVANCAWSFHFLNMRVAAKAAITGYPFGISDLFPRWLGAKALLAGQDPYSAGFTAELHRQYYGRVMSPAEEMTLFRNICEFFYPPFVLLPLLPLLWLPFTIAAWLTTAGLVLAIGACVWMWLGLLDVRSGRTRTLAAAASLLFLPSLDLILLQQLTGLVVLYLVAGFVLATKRRYAAAGLLLALAMIKPQGSAIPALALLFWALWERERWRMIGAFGVAMLGQLALAQALVPGWVGEFMAASARYQELNTISFWLPGQVLGSNALGAILIAAPLCGLLIYLWWQRRTADAGSLPVVRLMALTFVAGVVLMPDISYYNKVLLLPALLTVITAGDCGRRPQRLARYLALLAVDTPLLTMASAGLLYACGVAVGVASAVTAALMLSQLMGAFFLLTPVLVLPAAIAVCIRLPSLHVATLAGHVIDYAPPRYQHGR